MVCMNHQTLQATMRVVSFRTCICSQRHEFFKENTLNLRHTVSYILLDVGGLSVCMPLILVVHSTYIILLNQEFVRIRLQVIQRQEKHLCAVKLGLYEQKMTGLDARHLLYTTSRDVGLFHGLTASNTMNQPA